ncbi:MAG: PKD domain-containing protein, partial [Parafilimonas sp.]
MKCFFSVIILIIYSSASAQLTADFFTAGTQGCSPLNVQFKDNSVGSPTSWFWDFGNGITSSLQNPSVTYTVKGNYSVRLIIRNGAEQGFEEKINYITVLAKPGVNFNVISGDSGCVSLQSAFKDSTNFFDAPVKSWLWNFNDGSTSNQQNPLHTFTAAGKYNISLTAETTEGCSSSLTKSNAIRAGNKPVANFSASPLNGCASALRDFKNKSSGTITGSLWNFGDGGVSYDKNPLYHYQDTGTFNVKLEVFENGCKDSVTIPNYIHVEGPVSKFLTRFSCSDKFTIHLYDRSIDEINRLWNFDDGTTSTDENITHIYTSPGIYKISLIINGSTCSDTARDTLHIKATTPDLKIIPAKSFYCKYDTLQFVTENYDTADVKLFYWHFGDGAVRSNTADSITHVYKIDGNFKPIAYIRNPSGCTDTINDNNSVVIYGPTAGFSLDTTGCTNSNVTFKDTSTTAGSKITQWLWNYGDGITAITNGSSNYNYAYSGTYDVKLNLTDANTCTDSVIHTVNISSSPSVDAGLDTFACAGREISLKPTGASTYVWQSNPDLSCTNCTNPIVTPFQSSVYYVSGTTNGCSASDSVNVNVQTKEIIKAQPNAYSICTGDSVMLTASGADSYSWAPASTLSNPSISNPIAFPAINTLYIVTGKDSNNCFSDTALVNVVVNPSPTVNILDSSVQVLTGSTYNIATTASVDAQNPVWSPAIDLSCYNCLQPVATVAKTTTYTLKVSNQYGCIDSDKITITSVCTNESVF